ncbi:MAG: SpoIIE family protein phosphatase [Planctomycetia bacterium]|nr:SpoIIE family protein phosphatase [Planctomycetia bacterium]
MMLFVHFERKDKLNSAAKGLEEIVSNCCESLAIRMDNFARQVSFFTTLITDRRNNTVDVIRRKMEQMPELQGIAIAYDPGFLEKVRQGKFKDFYFDQYPGLDLSGSVPKFLCPVIYRQDKDLVISNEASKGYQYTDAYLAGKYLREGTWTDPFYSRISHKLCTSFALPFYHHEEFAGAVIMIVQLDALVKNLLRSNKNHDGLTTSRYVIVDKTSHILYHSEENPWKRSGLYSLMDELEIKDYTPDLDEILRGRLTTKHFPAHRYSAEDHFIQDASNSWLVSCSIKNESGWIFIGVFHEEDILRPVNLRLMRYLWIGLLSVFVLGILLSGLLIWFVQPLEEVIRGGQAIAEGDFTYRITKFGNRKDKLGVLVKAYNASLDHLQLHIDNAVKAMVKNRKMEQELLVAQDIQKSFLPTLKSKHREEIHYEVCGDLLPAHFMAGDFFDFWQLDEETVVMFVGDVSGKGIPAAMIMVETRTLLRTIISEHLSPGEVLKKLNSLLLINNIKSMFVSIFLVYYKIKTGVYQYANAGHNPPVLMYPDGNCEYFEFAQDTLIGLMEKTEYHTKERVLPVGATLGIYTDGVLDIVDPAGVPFGKERLNGLFMELGSMRPRDLVPEIIKRLKDYSDITQKDDITLLVFKRLEDKISERRVEE